MTLVRVAAPAVPPITLAEAKEQCRVDFSDDDALINRLIAAAVALVDGTGELGRAMVTQTWAEWLPPQSGRVRLRMGPVQSLVSVQYYDANDTLQTATLADFDVRPCGDFSTVGPVSGAAWPAATSRTDALKITYVAGFGDGETDVPEGIRHALLMTVAHWYERREALSEVDLKEVPRAVGRLIGNERVGWYG